LQRICSVPFFNSQHCNNIRYCPLCNQYFIHLLSSPLSALKRILDTVINSFTFDVNGSGQDVTSCLAAKFKVHNRQYHRRPWVHLNKFTASWLEVGHVKTHKVKQACRVTNNCSQTGGYRTVACAAFVSVNPIVRFCNVNPSLLHCSLLSLLYLFC
jgi:hypothetical protein